MAKAATQNLLGMGVEPSEDRILDPRTAVGEPETAVFRFMGKRSNSPIPEKI
jgi:hypothetical protein